MLTEDTYDDYIKNCETKKDSCDQLKKHTQNFLKKFPQLKEEDLQKFAEKLCYKVYFQKKFIYFNDPVKFENPNIKYNKTDYSGTNIGLSHFKHLFKSFHMVKRGVFTYVLNDKLLNENINSLLETKIGGDYIEQFHSYFYPRQRSLADDLNNPYLPKSNGNIANNYYGGTRTAKPKGNSISQRRRKSTSRSLTKRYYPKKIRRYTYTNRQKKQKRK
jgi:hypothetical protein